MRQSRQEGKRWTVSRLADRRVLAGVTLVVLAFSFYLYTLSPSVSWADGARLQYEAIRGESFYMYTVGNAALEHEPTPFGRLGIAAWDHPLWVMVTHAFTFLSVGDLPYRVNLVSAVFGALTAMAFFFFASDMTGSLPAAAIASAILAVSHTFWFHAVTPEVYALNTFLYVLVMYAGYRFAVGSQFRDLALAFFLAGLGISNHLLMLLALPALALVAARFRGVRRWYHVLALFAALAAGSSVYLIQAARMVRVFALATLATAAVGFPFASEILKFSLPTLLRSVGVYLGFLALQFGPVGICLGVYGWKSMAGKRQALWLCLAFFTVYTAFGLVYTVPDQFAFFLPSFLVFAILIAFGLKRILCRCQSRRWIIFLAFGALLPATAVTAYHFLPALAREVGLDETRLGIPQLGDVRDGLRFYLDPNKRGDFSASRYGQQTLSSLPPDALVIAEYYADPDTFIVLRYFQGVEGLRPDVTIIGWPFDDYHSFQSEKVHRLIQENIAARPIYLASLNERFYGISQLQQRYVLRLEHGLFRVLARSGQGTDTGSP